MSIGLHMSVIANYGVISVYSFQLQIDTLSKPKTRAISTGHWSPRQDGGTKLINYGVRSANSDDGLRVLFYVLYNVSSI